MLVSFLRLPLLSNHTLFISINCRHLYRCLQFLYPKREHLFHKITKIPISETFDNYGAGSSQNKHFENAEQFDSARVAYTTFVDNFPNHPLAHDTRQSLQYLGLSPAETLEAIQSQNTAL